MARRIRLDLILNDVGASVAQDWPGGDGVFTAEATFGGGNIALQMQTPNGTWVPVINYATTTAISITATGMANFRAPACKMRAVVTTSTAVFAYATGVPANVAG